MRVPKKCNEEGAGRTHRGKSYTRKGEGKKMG